jgi:hypothetical protein
MRVTLAMLFYFGLVFGVGFLLGPIRVLWLEPRFGPIIATACEAPFMLPAILVAARWVPRVLNIRRDPKTLVLIGVGSLILLQIADFTIGFWLRSITPKEQFVQLLTGQGNIYAALLALFAIMPWAANCWPELLKLHDHDRWGQL